MATKRFCDVCDALLQPVDDKDFIRTLFIPDREQQAGVSPVGRKVLAYVQITNENNHPLTDVCNRCKLKVVNEGTDEVPTPTTVATLQPQVAADARPAVHLFRPPPPALMPDKPPIVPPPKPPPPPPTNFEPSLPVPPPVEQ